MLSWIVGSSLKLRFLVIALAVVLLVFGAVRLRTMPVDVLPEFAPPMIEVQTEAPGLSPGEVESIVTHSVEELLMGVPWLRAIRSESVTGMSSVRLLFEPGTDIMRARTLVQERLINMHHLPPVAKAPVMLMDVSATNRVMMIGLTSKQVSPINLSVLAEWTIKPKLLGVVGVANVAMWGERRRQLHVYADPERLRAQGLKQEQLITSTGDSLWVSFLNYLKAAIPVAGGWIDLPQQRLEVRHVLPMSSPEELARVSVDGAEGLRLGDVAKVAEQHPLLIGDAVVNDGPGLLLVIEKYPAASTLEVTRGLDSALANLRLGFPGVDIDSSLFRAATSVQVAMDNHTKALLGGGLLAVLVLGAFFFEWRTALVSLVAIPASLLTAVVVLSQTGATLNTMLVAGLVLALAAIVDDAVAFTDTIARRLHQRRHEGTGDSTASIVYHAAVDAGGPIAVGTLIALLVVTPIFVMGGVTGAFVKPLALAYVAALAASLVVALSLTPALALLLFGKTASEPRPAPLLQWLQPRFDALLTRVVSAPQPALVTAAVLAVAGLSVWPLLGQSLVPAFKERDVLVSLEAAPETSYPQMSQTVTQAVRDLRTIPGVRKVSAHIGRAVVGDQAVNINSGRLWVSLDAGADFDRTLGAIRETVKGYPGISGQVGTYLQETVSKALTGLAKPMVVRVYGPERELLQRVAVDVKQALSRIDGLADVQVEGQVEKPQIKVKVDLDAAARVGLKPGDVRRQAALIFNGLEVGKIFEQQKVFDVVVWSAPETRNNVSSVRELLLETPSGGRVRLGDVAEVSVTPGTAIIRRDAVSNYIDVGANVAGRDVDSVVRDMERQLHQVRFPLEYHAVVLGEYAERQAARNRMLAVGAGAAIAIFFLLQAAFGSWRLATGAFLALPAALVGGVLAAFAGGSVLSLGSLVAFLGIVGIAARQGIQLIRHYQNLERHEGETFGPGLVLRGTRERLRPILTAAAATAGALLPLVYFGGILGLEIEHPMAVVMLGGLVTATLVNLFVVPALYLVFGSSPKVETERVVS